MNPDEAKLQKTIRDAEKAITAGKNARQQKRKAQLELDKLSQKLHLDRLYNIGRLAYDMGAHEYDDALLAGAFLRVSDFDEETKKRLREIGKEALNASRRKRELEVLFPERPDRSQAAILREAGLKKNDDVVRDGKSWSLYRGNASKPYLERRLKNTGMIINIVTS